MADVSEEKLAMLRQEKEGLDREVAVAAERLAALRPELARAKAFRLESLAGLQQEVEELERQLQQLEERLQATKDKFPAPAKPSVFREARVSAPPPLPAAEEAKKQEALQKLDELLQRVVSAEVAEKSTRVRVETESQVLELLESELRIRLRGFGQAEPRVEKRFYTLQEMKDNGVDTAQLLNPKDNALDAVRNVLLVVLALGGAAAILALKASFGAVVFVAFAGTFVLFLDQVANRGFGELLILDTLARLSNAEYVKRVALHEAGHFLVAYLVGILPKAYTLGALEAFSKYRSMSTQAGTVFFDEAIQREVQAGKISSKTLDRFLCVALGGLVAEYLVFGQASGGSTDIQQLEALFAALKFDQRRTNVQLRSALLNTVGLLEEHRGLHKNLAEAMARGASVGDCIATIERTLTSPEQGMET